MKQPISKKEIERLRRWCEAHRATQPVVLKDDTLRYAVWVPEVGLVCQVSEEVLRAKNP